jgi:hypothetical protein
MAVMIERVPRPQVRTRLRQALHDAAPMLWYGMACIVAVAVPVLLRVLAFFPE